MVQGQQVSRSGTDHAVMRELNRTLVLDLMRRLSPVSRAVIAREASLAKPTVSAIVESLIEEGLVRELGTGPAAAGGGRPPILLEFNRRSQFLIGVQVGVEQSNIVMADALGEELGRAVVETPKGGPARALDVIASEVEALLKRSGAERRLLAAVGVCVPGLVDMRTGACLLAPNLGWRDVPVSELLSRRLKVSVHVVNTADAAVVVEHVDGAAQGADNVVLLHVGRGVGAGILIGGRLLHGSFGLTGEIGHCRVPGNTLACNCGKTGCLETLTDGAAIARAAVAAVTAGRPTMLAAVPADELTARHVGEAAHAGDEVALETLDEAGRALGLAASWLINLFNPDVLLIGGGVAEAGEPLLGPLREVALQDSLHESSQRLEIRPWTFGRDAGVRGAVLVAMQNSENYYRVMFQG